MSWRDQAGRGRRAALAAMTRLLLLAFGATGRRLAEAAAALLPASWNGAAFAARGIDPVLTALGLPGPLVDDARVRLVVPEIAESGAVVPVEVSSAVPDSQRVLVLALDNPNTLAADFRLGGALLPRIGTRIKLAETTTVVAVVQSAQGLHAARQVVKVTTGGCGG